MKKQFQSKAVPRGTRTIWRYLGALFILFTFAIGNVWGAYDVPADGTVTLSQKVNNGGRFNVEASGVYHFRTSSGYSWDSSNGIKTQSNAGGVVFYLDASKEIEVGIVHTEAKNAHEVTVHVYSITESVYKQFDDNKAGAAESNRTFSTAPTSSTDGSFTISITAESKTFTGKKTLAAGYYAVVPVGEKSKTFFKTIKFTTTGGGTDVCPSGISITGEDEYLEGETISLTANKTAGNGEITYTWYKGADLATAKAAGALGTGATYTKSNCVTGDAGKYFCEATKTSCSGAASSGFDVTVEADTKCFNMPAITSKPSDLAHVTVTGGTLSDVSTAKAVAMNAAGLKLDGNYVYLKVSLASASIVEGTKITVAWKGAGSGAGIALVNENLEHKVIDLTGISDAAGSISHTFTAAEAADYADEFIIHRNASGTGIYVNAITVEDCGPAVTKHTITLNYNDGVTPNGSLKVVDGKAATQPTDPTRGKYTFLGWFVGDTDTEYVWSTAVTDDITLKAHWQDPWTITFNSDGGSEVASITVKHNTKAEKPADPTKASHDFNGWYIGDTDNAFDWDANVTADYSLKAHWLELVAKYDIEYYDGETKIGTEEQVRVDQHPTAAGISTDKPLYSFVGWYTSSTLEGDPVALNAVTPSEGLKLYGKWSKVYATTYDMEAYAVSDGASKAGLETALTAAGYAYTNINGIDNGHTHNYTYDGMKYKTNDGDLSFNVVAGKVVEVKTGHLPTNDAVTMYINGVADATVFEGADENIETHKTNYFYSAAEALYRLDVKASKGTCAVKAVTIRDPYQVTFNVAGGDPVSAQYGHPSITLPSASKGTDSFLGWFIGEDKIGEAGDSYTPTANVELVAHWEAVSTDARLSSITFSSDAGTLVPAWNMELTEYTYTMPYGTTAIPTVIAATANFTHDDYWYIESAATAWGETTIVRGKAVSGDTKAYSIKMEIAPKDGVCLIKGNVGNNTFVIDEEASLLSGTPSKSNVKSESSTYETLTGWKFNSRPAHLGLTLSEGTFQAGDVVEVFVTSEANGGGTTHKMRVFDAADATPAHVLAESAADMVQGANRLVLPATSTSSLYLHRGASGADYENWNPYVAYFAVYRPMNPMLTAMTIDGRTVTINEDAKTATVTIPYESDLANLTIAKTIVWNAPATENSIVVNGGSAWVIGENTYKLTDKDGDATTYTITVARDVLKHTVSFNTHGGSAVASVEVEHNAYLTAVPNDPSKEDYIFQYWSLTDGGEEVDVTTVQINEDKEFHAVWVSDGGIKLLDGSTVNHTNFITAVTATETVEFKGNTVNYAKFAGTCGSVTNVKDLTKVIAYNATTNKTRIQISAHNNSTSARSILVKGLVEGASAAVDLATIALGNKEDKVSDWIEFDNAANRTIYIMVGSSAGDVYFTQVKVIESGETPMKQVGEAGYALNLNKGRFFGLANTDLAFEGLNARLSGDYTALNSGYAKLNATSMSFTVASDMNLVVTTNNSKTYYVTKGAAGTDNETAKTGESEFDLTAGTWYITAGSSEVQFTNIAFELPKAAKPVVAAMDDVEYCQGSAIDALTVSATVSDGGTMLYQWYKDNEIIAGAEAETYQPTADGEYYVVVVNTKAGYQNSDAVQSNTITVTGYAATVLSGTTGAENWPGEDATISVTASGKNLHYAWYTCDDAMGTNPVAVEPAVDAAELNVTIAAADTYYKVVVSGDCGDAQEAVITVVARQAVELQDVTGDMSWDFSKANDGSAASSNLCNDEVLANVHGINNNDDFKSAYLKATANKFSSNKLQASMIKFHTTVGGIVTVVFSHTGNNKTDGRALVVNGTYQSELSHNQTAMTYKCYVPAGDVVLTSTTGDGGAMLNFTSVDFKAKAEADYTRNVSNNIGTLCVDHNVLVGGAMGATFYQIASRNELYNDKIDFEEVLPNEELKAGEPYIFHSNTGKIELFYGETVATEPVAVRGMIGSFVNTTLDITEENKSSIMYIAQNKLWNCEDLVVSDLEVVANRAYIVMSDVPTYAEYQEALQQQQNPAPRRRVTLGRNAEQVATGIGEVQGDKVQSTKVLIDGHIYILRGEKMFDAKGQLVK